MSWESSRNGGVERDKREKITSSPFTTVGTRGSLNQGILSKMAVSNMLNKRAISVTIVDRGSQSNSRDLKQVRHDL